MLRSLVVLLMCTLALAASATAKPIKVEVVGKPGEYTLLRGGKPYFINGAGGTASQKLLVSMGGNSGRTWGADDLQSRLDEAHALGLSIAVGIWLEHPRHGFDYNDKAKVAAQLEKARAAVLKYKDHPAVLLWGVGNEMEGDGNDPAVFRAVNDIAKMIKSIDPNHPTMTVIAELGEKGQKVKHINELCPDIDIVGINVYGGGASVAKRYKEFGGTKPFIITEFGPLGAWEIGRNDFGAPSELTSTEKALTYRKTYEASVLGAKGMCLGSYAFLWGHKFEATSTWFGMLLPDDTRLAAADVMSELWTGKPPANRVPVIESFTFEGPDRGKPGDTLRVRLVAKDPEGDPLRVEYIVLAETGQYITGGDEMATPDQFKSVVKSPELTGCTIVLPAQPGVFRIYVAVRDGKGGGATASLPMLSGPAPTPKK